MKLPNLDSIVDTYIRINDFNLHSYFSQIRTEMVPLIREFERTKKINWYSFLVHNYSQINEISKRENPGNDLFIHIYFSLFKKEDRDKFIDDLPRHFQKPIKRDLSDIAGININFLKDKNWVYAWKLLGDTSEWIVQMLETLDENIDVPIGQICQFLHFFTNPLLIGGRCCFFPNGYVGF